MKFVRPSLFSILLLALVLAGAIFFLPHVHSAKASSPQTWYIRPDGGTRYDSNVPMGQCDGLADAPYPGTGVDQHCAFNDFRFMWDDQTYNSNSWVMAGGDTVIIEGCHANAQQANPSNPDCRIGWDENEWGGQPNFWCLGGGPYGLSSYGCYNPPIPAGTASDPTRILGGNYQNCSVNNQPDTTKTATLFGGFSVLYTLSLADTQYVDLECVNITSHNGACTIHGSPSFPRGCDNNYPLDDYDGNGIAVDANTSNITLQDVAIDGHTTAGIQGPIGANITLNRVFIGFNGFAGWNFDDGHDTPNGPGSSINANYVTMEGNGCYQQWPITNPQFPARACYDDVSGGFGDSWSGQDSPLTSFTCNHCVQIYNTKDGFIGPHTQISNLVVENSASIGNMGQQWKWDNAPGGSVTFENNLTVGGCFRMDTQLPGAVQSFALSTGLPGSYLSDFCRAAGDVFSFSTQSNSTVLLADNTIVTDANTVFDMNCGPAGGGAGNCGTSPIVFKNNIFYGLTNPYASYPQAAGLFYLSDPSDVVSSSYNIEYGIRNGDPCGGTIICSDPLLGGEPPQSYTTQTQFDNLTFVPSAGSPAIGAGIAVSGISTDYNGNTRSNPPTIGAVEAGSSGFSSGGSSSTPPPSDTTPPTTSVTSPSNSASVSGTINVTASASDNVSVSSVGFYVDGSLKGTDSSSPYTLSLNTTSLSNGTHTLYTKAYDAAGNIGTSATITFTVNNAAGDTTPPSTPTGLSVTTVTASSISLSWSASTDNVGVTGYNIYRGGVKIGTSNTNSYTDSGLSASTNYSYTVSAYDAAGNTSAQSVSVSGTTSAASSNNPVGPAGYTFCSPEGYNCSFSGTQSVAYGAGSNFVYLTLTNITLCANNIFTDPDVGVTKACFTKPITSSTSDTTPPTTSITAPSSGATESGTISISASASDNVGVASVALYVDGSLQGTDNTSPYAFSLNTATLSNGTHAVYTKAYDAAGNVGTSGSISFTISNTIASSPSSPSSGGGTSGGGGGTSVSIAPSFEITSVSVNNITQTSAQIAITTHAPASVMVKYGKTTLYGMTTSVSPLLTTNYENLTNLTPGTVYDFIVIATPLNGTSLTSQAYDFSTLAMPGISGTSGAGATSTSSALATPSAFTTNIAYGDANSQVTLLQTILHSQGFLPGALGITDYFGIQTEHALLLFQSAHDLNKSGFVDEQTQALLNKIEAAQQSPTIQPAVTTATTGTATPSSPTGSLTQNLAPGSTGVQVTILQHILNADGDYPSAIYTQFYGSLTEAAVKIFQAKYGIATYGAPGTTGYGAVGPKTRAKLNTL